MTDKRSFVIRLNNLEVMMIQEALQHYYDQYDNLNFSQYYEELSKKGQKSIHDFTKSILAGCLRKFNTLTSK